MIEATYFIPILQAKFYYIPPLHYKEDSKHFGELTYEILFPIAEAILYDAQQWGNGSIPHSLQLKLETSYELLLLLQVVLTCNLIRIQLLVLDGNPSKFPFEANGGEKRRKISGISVKSQQCTHVRHVQQRQNAQRLLATQLPTDPSNEQFLALIC